MDEGSAVLLQQVGTNGNKDFLLGAINKLINDRLKGIVEVFTRGTSEEIKTPETSSYLLSSL